LIPLLTLGIPGGSSTAILLSALIIWGVHPGPLMMTESPDIFWGLVASMYIGNIVLLVLNLPMVPVFAQILRLPVYVLFPFIFGISIVGVYGTTGRMFDLGLLAGFGLLGYLMGKLKFPLAPLILGFVLGDAMERALRQSMMMYGGDFTEIFRRPISATMLALAGVVLVMPLLTYFNRLRLQAVAEGDEA
jgi:putative tricarboxylic transport membrane protein